METEAARGPADAALEPPFFQVGLSKLALMSVFTLGFCDLFWSYKQWDAFRRRTGRDLYPILRSILAMPFFFFPLFRDISKTTAARSAVTLRFPVLLAAGFFFLSLIVFIPSWLSALSFLAVVPLVVVQSRINAFHVALGLDPKTNTRLTALNLLGVFCGVVAYGICLWPLIRWFIETRLAA